MTLRSDRRTAAALKLLAEGARSPKVVLSGNSMEPTLREGMALELAPYERERSRVGDVVVFLQEGRLVAHRIVGFARRGLRTCGDARPWSPETVESEDVVGLVASVYESAAPQARHLAGPPFRRGASRARTRVLRALSHRVRSTAAVGIDVLPWRRKRRFEALARIAAGFVRQDRTAVREGLAAIDAATLANYARLHACSSILRAALALVPEAPAVPYLQRRLQLESRRTALRAIAMRNQVASLARLLQTRGIPFALLKGAARVYSASASSLLHPSGDLDLLVPRPALDDAIAALQGAGYRFRADAKLQQQYREEHHHAAPLFPPPGTGLVVELHHQLAAPGALSTPTDWNALAAHMTFIPGPAGPVRALDSYGVALHYSAHAVGLFRLRDAILCAQALAQLDPAALRELRSSVLAERRDPVRFQAVLLLAAHLAGIEWPGDEGVCAYLGWVMRREAMPFEMGSRTHVLESWFATRGRELLSPAVIAGADFNLRRTIGAFALAPLAAAYASLIPSS